MAAEMMFVPLQFIKYTENVHTLLQMIHPCMDHLSVADFHNGVYDPDSDSFCLMDALEKEMPALYSQRAPKIVFDFGCGSGILSAHSRLLIDRMQRENQQANLCYLYSLDINPFATRSTMEAFRLNPASHAGSLPYEIIHGNITNRTFLQRFHGLADLILWNPPYVPSEAPSAGTHTGQIDYYHSDYACAGGEDGTDVIHAMFPTAVDLLSPSGSLYVLMIEQNNPQQTADALCARFGLTRRVVFQRLSGERYTIFRFQKRGGAILP